MTSEVEELFADWLASEGEDERRDPWPEPVATSLRARAEAAALASLALDNLEQRRARYAAVSEELAAVLDRYAAAREALEHATELAASAGVHYAVTKVAA